MLARTLEAHGLSTVLITMMPFWAEKIGVPRTLAVEHPFSQTLGQPHNREQQMHVVREALRVLESAKVAGTITHSTSQWPVPQKEAMKQWQPSEPSPIIAVLAPQMRQMLRQHRKQN